MTVHQKLPYFLLYILFKGLGVEDNLLEAILCDSSSSREIPLFFILSKFIELISKTEQMFEIGVLISCFYMWGIIF